MGIKKKIGNIKDKADSFVQAHTKGHYSAIIQALKPKLIRWASEYGQRVAREQKDNTVVQALERHPIGREVVGLILGEIEFPEVVEPLVNGGWAGFQEGVGKKAKKSQDDKNLAKMESVFKSALREQFKKLQAQAAAPDQNELIVFGARDVEDAAEQQSRVEVHYKHCPRGLREIFKAFESNGQNKVQMGFCSLEEAEAEGWPLGKCCQAIKGNLDKLKAAEARPELTLKEAQDMIDQAVKGLEDQIHPRNLWETIALTDEQKASLKKNWSKFCKFVENKVTPEIAKLYRIMLGDINEMFLDDLERWGKRHARAADKLKRARKRRRRQGTSLAAPMPSLRQDRDAAIGFLRRCFR